MGGNKGFGLRAGTRSSFSRGFRQKGMIPLTTYLRTYKVGDYVDIKVNPAVHKGMPFKFYHGRTGVIWNVTKRALGVELNKTIGNRQLKKRIHVRVEHVQPSRCREDFLARRVSNDIKKAEAKKAGVKADVKRKPAAPREGLVLENVKMTTVTAIPYDIVREGIKY